MTTQKQPPHRKGRYKGIGAEGDTIEFSLNDILFLWSKKDEMDELYNKLRSFKARKAATKNNISTTDFFKKHGLDLHYINILKEMGCINDTYEWASDSLTIGICIQAKLRLDQYYRNPKDKLIDKMKEKMKVS